MSDNTAANREHLAEVRAELEQIGARMRHTLARLEDISGPALPLYNVRDDAALLLYEATQKVSTLQRRVEWRLSGGESY